MRQHPGNKGKKPIRIIEKDYFESGEWKCADSSTGAHRWNCNIDPPVCLICGKVKSVLPK